MTRVLWQAAYGRGSGLLARRHLCSMLLLILAAGTPAIAAELRGQPAPDFALKSSTGSNLRLAEFRGAPVLLTFWAGWCQRCQEQLRPLAKVREEFAAAGLEVLAVDIASSPPQAREAVTRHGLVLLLDQDAMVARQYAPGSLPMTLLIDQHGRVREIYRTYRSGDEQTWRLHVAALLRE